jgi:exodeoxyribonuclease-5
MAQPQRQEDVATAIVAGHVERPSEDQSQALRGAGAWLRGGKATGQVFYLAGFAGTGKTSLAKMLAAEARGRVLYCAFTGKAASVLRSKGCPDATTIHSLIYLGAGSGGVSRKALRELEERLSKEQDSARRHELQKEIDRAKAEGKRMAFRLNPDSKVRDAALVVVDEASMVDGKVGADLLSFGTKVLVLGDPGQLPPVQGRGFFTERRPDFLLQTIHRQAEGNPILRLADLARRGQPLPTGAHGASHVIPWAKMDKDVVLRAEQILVWRNATRHAVNARVREMAGIDISQRPFPVALERLVCLRNNHEEGLLNGCVYVAQHDAELVDEGEVLLHVEPEEGGAAASLTAMQEPFLGREPPPFSDVDSFGYAHALTVHKAQGSQWGRVLVMDDYRGADRNKWLYTAITRAADRVIVAQK